MATNNYSDGNFTRIKKVLIGVSGAAMLIASVILSKQGIGFVGNASWIGLVIAISLTCAEFMFNSNFDEMNWTILILGIGAYGYSISTNINGFYSYQGIEGTLWTNFDMKSFLGGIFMDVYPELALAWSLKESKVGDLVGNLIKSWTNPERMTESTPRNQSQRNGNSNNNQPQVRPASSIKYPDNLPRQSSNNSNNNGQSKGNSSSQISSQFRPAPKPVSQSRNLQEPTYHPISYQNLNEKEKEGFDA
jgi:hypothetical protein